MMGLSFGLGEILGCFLFLLLLLLLVAAYVISGIIIYPPYYVHGHHNSTKLCSAPEGAAGIVWKLTRPDGTPGGFSDPKTDLGLDFVNITFPALKPLPRNRFLSGWLVPSSSSYVANINTLAKHTGDDLTQIRQFVKTSERPIRLSDKLCVICVHGGGRDRRAWLRHIPVFNTAGYAVFLFDMQEHGLSDGCQRGIGWGTFEANDTLAAVRLIKTLGYEKVVVMGTSMGAAGCIIAASRLQRTFCAFAEPSGQHVNPAHCPTLPITSSSDPYIWKKMIDGVIAENPFCTRYSLGLFLIRTLSRHRLNSQLAADLIHVFSFLIVSILLFRVKWRGGDVIEPAEAISGISVPILLMHGTSDIIIPHSHTQNLFERCRECCSTMSGLAETTMGADKADSRKPQNINNQADGSIATMWIAEGASHCALYDKDKDGWKKHVLSHLEMVSRKIMM